MSGAQTDLTQGGVLQQLIRYSVPIITSSMLQALYGLTDMLIVSQFMGSAGASAVNNASQITRIVTNIVIGFSTGGSVLVGQYFGSGDKENRERAIGTFFSLFALLGIAFSAALAMTSRSLLHLLRAPAIEEAYPYLFICSMGVIFVFGYNTLASVLRAVGNSRKPLECILIAAILNVGLDLLFIGVFKMGTAGAAYATVIAQAASAGSALIYLLRHREIFSFSGLLHMDRVFARRIFVIGLPGAVQMTIASLSWLTVTYLINGYGVVYSAGNGIAAKIRDFSHLFISSMSVGTSAMIAQTLGARLYDRAKEVMYTAMRMSVAVAAVIIIVLEITAPWLAGLFIDDPAVIHVATLNLRIEIIAELFYASFLIYHSLMVGAGHTYMALISSFVNCIVFRMALAIWFNSLWGITGVFIACMISPASSIPIGYFYTRSGHWRTTLAERS